MRACPVCETSVEGLVCEVCGHAFPLERAPSPDIPPLPGLERAPTLGATTVAPLLDLEPTRTAPALMPVPDGELEPDWEQTAEPGTPDVPAGGLPELDLGRETEVPERTAPSTGPVTCRYCRNVQATGMLCDRCGMRLPWSRRVALAAAPAERAEDAGLVRCPRCGERTYPRERCASCGSLLAVEV